MGKLAEPQRQKLMELSFGGILLLVLCKGSDLCSVSVNQRQGLNL